MLSKWHIHEGKWMRDRGYSAQKSGQLAHSIFTYSIIYGDYLYSLRRFCMFYRHLSKSVFKVYKWCAERIKLRDLDYYLCNLRRFCILYWKLCKSVVKVYEWSADRINLRDVDCDFCNLRRFCMSFWHLSKSLFKVCEWCTERINLRDFDHFFMRF